jgi:hypothetical protein
MAGLIPVSIRSQAGPCVDPVGTEELMRRTAERNAFVGTTAFPWAGPPSIGWAARFHDGAGPGIAPQDGFYAIAGVNTARKVPDGYYNTPLLNSLANYIDGYKNDFARLGSLDGLLVEVQGGLGLLDGDSLFTDITLPPLGQIPTASPLQDNYDEAYKLAVNPVAPVTLDATVTKYAQQFSGVGYFTTAVELEYSVGGIGALTLRPNAEWGEDVKWPTFQERVFIYEDSNDQIGTLVTELTVGCIRDVIPGGYQNPVLTGGYYRLLAFASTPVSLVPEKKYWLVVERASTDFDLKCGTKDDPLTNVTVGITRRYTMGGWVDQPDTKRMRFRILTGIFRKFVRQCKDYLCRLRHSPTLVQAPTPSMWAIDGGGFSLTTETSGRNYGASGTSCGEARGVVFAGEPTPDGLAAASEETGAFDDPLQFYAIYGATEGVLRAAWAPNFQFYGRVAVVWTRIVVVQATVAAGGAGHSVGQEYDLEDNGGPLSTKARFRVDAVAGGVVTAISILSEGAYTVGGLPGVVTVGGDIDLNLTYGINAILVDGGEGYEGTPTISIAPPPAGVPAAASLVMSAADGSGGKSIASVNTTNNGSGYFLNVGATVSGGIAASVAAGIAKPNNYKFAPWLTQADMAGGDTDVLPARLSLPVKLFMNVVGQASPAGFIKQAGAPFGPQESGSDHWHYIGAGNTASDFTSQKFGNKFNVAFEGPCPTVKDTTTTGSWSITLACGIVDKGGAYRYG